MRPLTHSGRENAAACISTIVLTALALIARFAVRVSQGQHPFGSDWLCLWAAVMFYAYCGLILEYILSISGDGSSDLHHGKVVTLLKIGYALQILIGSVITSTKLSILWFYYQVFSGVQGGGERNRLIIKIAAVICSLWFIIVTFIVIFQCTPVYAFWFYMDQAPYCMSTPHFLLGYEITNLFLDVFVLCIPIPILSNLRLSSSKKSALIGVFMLGSFVCVASIVRLTQIWEFHDPMMSHIRALNFPNTLMWSTLQLGLAITCAGLPTLAPILRAITKPWSYIQSWSASWWSHFRTTSARRGYKFSDNLEMLHPNEQQSAQRGRLKQEPFVHGCSESWARGNDSQTNLRHDADSVPPMRIMVDRSVNVA